MNFLNSDADIHHTQNLRKTIQWMSFKQSIILYTTTQSKSYHNPSISLKQIVKLFL